MTIIVLQLVAMVVGHVERLIFDPPFGSMNGHDHGNTVSIHRHVGDPTVAMEDFSSPVRFLHLHEHHSGSQRRTERRVPHDPVLKEAAPSGLAFITGIVLAATCLLNYLRPFKQVLARLGLDHLHKRQRALLQLPHHRFTGMHVVAIRAQQLIRHVATDEDASGPIPETVRRPRARRANPRREGSTRTRIRTIAKGARRSLNLRPFRLKRPMAIFEGEGEALLKRSKRASRFQSPTPTPTFGVLFLKPFSCTRGSTGSLSTSWR